VTLRRTSLSLVFTTLAAVFSGCGGDELQANEDHRPFAYSILIDDVPVSPPYSFVDGQTVQVRIKFFNAAGEDLDDVESGHFGRLTFDPITLATAERRDDHHYQFEVTGGTPGSGTVEVGYGHDGFADEVSFDPAPVTVVPSGGGNPQ
jgi:hypothetical protein